MPALITKSLNSGPSPTMFPNAHTACSATFACVELRSLTKAGTAPLAATACV